ncbi:MAG: hypothetical protein AAGD13_18810 [Pseudomonadota bacterium]
MMVREAKDLTEASRMFAEMYSSPECPLSEAEAASRLERMQTGPWRVTEACIDDQVAGFALWTDLVEYIFVRSFAIDQNVRTGGLGARFLTALRTDVWGEGREVRLEVAPGGPSGFWNRLGFTAMTTGMWLSDEVPA